MFHPASHSKKLLSLLAFVLSMALPTPSSADGDRKGAANRLAGDIEGSQIRKIYVADFLDPSGARNEKGCYFASAFSTLLAGRAQKFEVVNRIEAQKQLDELHISPQDLHQPKSLSKAALALGVDSILLGSLSLSTTEATLHLTLQDAASGKELHSMEYREHLEPSFAISFPDAADARAHFYYFPGLDGVSVPKCISCPQPNYSDDARRNKLQGVVLMSVRVTETGTIASIRVVKDPGHGMAEQSLDVVKTWRLEPSRDPAGNPVAVQVPVETTFRLYFGKHPH